MGGSTSTGVFFPLNGSVNKLILATSSHAAVQNSILLKHNYWSPKLRLLPKSKQNPEKTLKIFLAFELVRLGTYMSLKGENQVH